MGYTSINAGLSIGVNDSSMGVNVPAKKVNGLNIIVRGVYTAFD
jgi:phage-related holin